MPKKANKSNSNESRVQHKDVQKVSRKDKTLPENPSSMRNQIIIIVLAFVAVLLTIIMILTNTRFMSSSSKSGVVGYYICKALYGILGSAAYFVPAVLAYLAIVWHRSKKNRTCTAKVIVSIALIVVLATAFYIGTRTALVEKIDPESKNMKEMILFKHFKDVWIFSREPQSAKVNLVSGGGIVGAFFGGLFYIALKEVSWVIIILALMIGFMVLTELSPAKIIRFIKNTSAKIKAASEKSKKEKEEKRIQREKFEAERARIKSEKPTNLIFPEDNKTDEEKATISIYNRKPKDVGISPIEYSNVEANSAAADPKITETLPPVLSKDSKSNAPEKPAAEEKKTEVKNPPEKADSPDSDILSILFQDSDENDRKEEVQVEYDDKNTPDSADVNIGIGRKTKTKSEPEKQKTTEEQFAEISDLQESDENDHALTDPDYNEENEKKLFENYIFPPITLLSSNANSEAKDYSEELQANGIKLVNALESFKVKAKITHISRGPTITRYELLPDQGVRIRAIANLVDDIALNLETSGVRIEAPIPGKAAVGIEVPNKEKETIYLRELLENPKFTQASSKLTAALGTDVAGEPIFIDIAKMPHLLIAGTTGSGKSVCINSLLISLLYHAKPDEVKLILIDPKKVELSVYGNLPHLLIPVVTNPKKAAGSLTWAVTEMDRRYDLFEDNGVRDVTGYNKLADSKGDMEKLPSIVIIIDELADLMLTAPDTVEESINRIAAKARAAGMHLIVGTQRPSVDVVTGLIKANIPSRIAFTVVSNVDSRTIIDIAGAEKLCGRGDMLFSPVGSMKPIRVQGAFVSDSEVESVCEFIKNESGGANYNQKAIDGIRECEAACEETNKKKSVFGPSGGSDDDEADPKFHEAVQVAIESGKVSTSLLQRRLQLGYGRAAKIIDKMEEMGIVSAPDGQKPRNVLITLAEYQEMMMQLSDKQ